MFKVRLPLLFSIYFYIVHIHYKGELIMAYSVTSKIMCRSYMVYNMLEL